jgi:hypothetical protein
MTDEEGILYVATGDAAFQEAAASARAGRKHAGGRAIVVCTDRIGAAEHADVFDRVLPHPGPVRGYRDKIQPLIDPPFSKTLYLDADARLVSCCDGLFRLLETCDLAAAHAPVRIPQGWNDPLVPAVFPEFNSGVILLKRSPQQRACIDEWLHRYDDIGQEWDQATFRSAVWSAAQSGLRIGVLPPEANLRTTKPWIAGKGVPVMIVHGRIPDSEWSGFLSYLNDDCGRFRTSDEWRRLRPDTRILPNIAPVAATHPAPAAAAGLRESAVRAASSLPDRLRDVDARWPDGDDEPLACEDPIFILSAGWRSGSTLLQRMILADGRVMVWGEPFAHAHPIQRMSAMWRAFTAEWPNLRHTMPPAGEPLHQSWVANLSPPVRELRAGQRRFLDRVFGEPARRMGRAAWGIKEVRWDTQHAVWLRWLFPQARFLFLVRHPHDAYLSYKPRGPWFFRWPEMPVQGASAFANVWSHLAADFHRHHCDVGGLLVRYEDLEDEADRICAHLGVQVAKPSGLVRQSGHAEIKADGRVRTVERMILAARTARVRRLYGY